MHSAKLAKHSGGTTIQVKDVQLELGKPCHILYTFALLLNQAFPFYLFVERNWNIRVPGYEGGITETSTAPKKSLAAAQANALNASWTSQGSGGNHIHNQRLAALSKAKRDIALSAGLKYMEVERRAEELASIYELGKGRGGEGEENGEDEDDISGDVLDVSVVEVDGDGDGEEGEVEGDEGDGVGDVDQLEDEASEEMGDGSVMDTPNFADSPHVSV